MAAVTASTTHDSDNEAEPGFSIIEPPVIVPPVVHNNPTQLSTLSVETENHTSSNDLQSPPTSSVATVKRKRRNDDSESEDDGYSTSNEKMKSKMSVGRSTSRGKKSTDIMRKNALENDKFAKRIFAHEVTCVGCNKVIKLHKTRPYDTTHWNQHREKCPQITGRTHVKKLVKTEHKVNGAEPYCCISILISRCSIKILGDAHRPLTNFFGGMSMQSGHHVDKTQLNVSTPKTYTKRAVSTVSICAILKVYCSIVPTY